MVPPTVTEALRDVFSMKSRKSPSTVVVAHDRLFAGVASSGVAPVAQLVTAPLSVPAASTVSVTRDESPCAIGPGVVQVTTGPTAEHVHPVPAPEVNARPAGSVSTIVIAPCVGTVPRFATLNR